MQPAALRAVLSVVLADARAGVRAGLRTLLAGAADLAVVAEAGTVAAALAAPGDVVLTGLHLEDGTAAEVCGGSRPVVVVTWLPADERTDVDLSGAAAVVELGGAGTQLPSVLRAVTDSTSPT